MKLAKWAGPVLGMLLLAVAAAALLQVWPLLYPEIAASAPLDPDCNLRGAPCTGRLPDGTRVIFAIQPADIPVVVPLQLTVVITGGAVASVEVDFAGVDMNMGYNRVALQPEGPGRFTGTGILPVCVRARMTWEARVLLHTPGGLLAAPFRFDTYQPGRQPRS
jgi:hypothetical protein